MLQTVRLIIAVAGLATIAMPLGLASSGSALAQAGEQSEAPPQVTLTQPLIDRLIATQPEMSAAQEKAQGGNSDQPDPKLQAALERIAKAHGFASIDAYGQAVETVGLVLGGMDPETKTYVGPAALIKKQMAEVQADKSLPPADKARTLSEMKEALANAGTVQPAPGNAELVTKNFDKLSEAFQSGD